MLNFQNTFKTRKRSFISAFSICVTVPFRSKKACGLKTAESIIYVKECFYMFFSTLKDILQAQKINH